MEKEISGFESWLESVELQISGYNISNSLEVISRLVNEKFSARVWFANIFGNRWSYIAGKKSDLPSLESATRITLTNGVGLITGSWGLLGQRDIEKLETFLRRLLSQTLSRGNE